MADLPTLISSLLPHSSVHLRLCSLVVLSLAFVLPGDLHGQAKVSPKTDPRYVPYPGVYQPGLIPGMFRRKFKLEENRKGMQRYLADMDWRLAADQPGVLQPGVDVPPHERQVHSAILAAEYPAGRGPDFQNTGAGAPILQAWFEGQKIWAANLAQQPTARSVDRAATLPESK